MWGSMRSPPNPTTASVTAPMSLTCCCPLHARPTPRSASRRQALNQTRFPNYTTGDNAADASTRPDLRAFGPDYLVTDGTQGVDGSTHHRYADQSRSATPPPQPGSPPRECERERGLEPMRLGREHGAHGAECYGRIG